MTINRVSVLAGHPGHPTRPPRPHTPGHPGHPLVNNVISQETNRNCTMTYASQDFVVTMNANKTPKGICHPHSRNIIFRRCKYRPGHPGGLVTDLKIGFNDWFEKIHHFCSVSNNHHDFAEVAVLSKRIENRQNR